MDIPVDFSGPTMRTVVLPMLVSLVAVGVIRLLFGSSRGGLLANAAASLGFLGAYLYTIGLPAWPPVLPGTKIAFIAATGLVIGALLDVTKHSKTLILLLLVAWPTAILSWISSSHWSDFESGGSALSLSILVAAGILGFVRLDQERDSGLIPSIMLATMAGGVGIVALLGSAGVTAGLCFSLAASVVGYMVWNWPVARFPFGASALFGAGGALAGLTGFMVMQTPANPIPIGVLALVLFADGLLARIKIGSGGLARATVPGIFLMICLIPVGVATGIAYYLNH